MRKILFLIVVVFFAGILLDSCGSKKEASEIKNLIAYTDQLMNFSIKYPDNWFIRRSDGFSFAAFTNKAVDDRIANNYSMEGEAGAMIKIESRQFTDKYNFDSLKNFKLFTAKYYSAPEKITLDGVDAVKQTYTFELKDGTFKGEIYYATKDNQVGTVIRFEAFAGVFDKYKDKFAEILQSVKLAQISKAKPDTITKIEKAPLPSQNLVLDKNSGYAMLMPDNFSSRDMTPPAGGIKSINYIGERRGDCNIRIDVFDASKQKNLDKIVNDNKANYQNASPQQITMGGVKAYLMNYSPRKDIMSRIYFVVKNDKLYRITMNWFKGEEADYLPVFEKCIGSFRFE